MNYLVINPQPNDRRAWTRVHEPAPITREPADETSDVFNAVAAIEQTSIDETKLNLNGIEIMNAPTQLATALTAAGITTTMSGSSFFDPMDTVQDTINLRPMLYERVTSSLAWSLDKICITNARILLFKRYAENREDVDNASEFNDFCQEITDDLIHESLYETDGPELHLAQLLALRQQWHDIAQSAAAANNRDYRPQSLRESMLGEKPQRLDTGARQNFMVVANASAKLPSTKKELDQLMPTDLAAREALASRLLRDMEAAHQMSSEARVTSNKELIPTLLTILDTVNRHAESDTRFDQLPAATQRQLTRMVITATQRSVVELATRLAKQPIEFAHTNEDARKLIERLEQVIADKFTDKSEDYAGTPQTDEFNRNQKRVAASIY